MKKLLMILGLLGFPILALAQTNTLTTTTLSGALTSNATYVMLASSTGVNVATFGANGSFGYVDREMFQIVSVSPPGTTTNVQYSVVRGVNGTAARAHASGALVFIGNGDWFDGSPIGTGEPAGTCVIANIYAYPIIHILDGTVFTCDSLKLWGYAGPSVGNSGTRNSVTQVSATYTATYWDNLIEVTSGTFVLTMPAAAAYPGKVYLLVNHGTGTTTVTTVSGCATMTTLTACRAFSDGTSWVLF